MGQRLEVAIVGAGPAGLALALYLHRAGHHATIFERFDRPAPVGSGLILQPTGLSVLADLGLFDEIRTLGNRIDRLYGADARSGRTVLNVRYTARPGGRFGIAVHRAALFGVLHRAVLAAGIAVETSAEADTVDTGGGRARLIASGGRALGTFDLVVDASGTRSRLNPAVRGPSQPRQLAYGAFWATLDWLDEGFEPHALMQRYDRASVMIGVLPIGRAEAGGAAKAAFFWSLKPADADAVRTAGLDAWKGRVASLWPACAGYLSQISDFNDMTLARYAHHTLARPVGRRFAIIGDAAHSTSPQLGQGANMALLDAASLGHAMERTSDPDTALAAYADARQRHVRVFQALSSALHTVLPVGFARSAIHPRPAGAGPGGHSSCAETACRNGCRHAGRSLRADRNAGAGLA